jgi:hypothetical protein
MAVERDKEYREYIAYRMEEIKEKVGVLHATLDRRFPPDEAVMGALETLELDVNMLTKYCNK